MSTPSLTEPARETTTAKSARSVWTDRAVWGALALAGFLAWSHFSRPGLGMALACVKFGWTDFRTALWLRRFDPHRGRAYALFWFYLASGLWRITIAAFWLTVIIVLATTIAQGRGPIPRALFGSGLTAILGLCLLSFVPIIGSLFALRSRVRVWIDATVDESRRESLWPPLPYGKNKAEELLGIAFIIPILATCMLTAPRGVVIFLGAVLAEILVALWIGRRVVARHPHECWPEISELVCEAAPEIDPEPVESRGGHDHESIPPLTSPRPTRRPLAPNFPNPFPRHT